MNERLREHAPPVLLTAAAALALAPLVARGWVPFDEGQLGQSAERLLAGDVPHRDVYEAYTGALTLLHAAAFEVLGPTLTSLRWALLAAVLSTIPTLYAIASRAVPPAWAAVTTAAAIAWGPVVYFASMPTWYTTALAVHATWCLLRYGDTGRRRWLFAAGALGGLAITFKVVGLYQVAAALLFLVLLARTGGPGAPAQDPHAAPPSTTVWIARAAAPVAAAVLALFVVGTVWRRLGFWPVVVLITPAVAGAVALALRRVERPAPLLGPVACYGLAVALPIGALVATYAALGALGPLVEGVLIAPARRLEVAAMDLQVSPLALPIVGAWAGAALTSSPTRARAATLCAAVLSLWFVALGAHVGPYQLAWSVAQLVGPAAAVVGAVRLLREPASSAPARALFLVTTTAGLMGLVQFPYGFGGYFSYTAPVVAIAAAHVAGASAPALRPAQGIAAAGLLAFAGLWVYGASGDTISVHHAPRGATRELRLPRAGGLAVPVHDADDYEAMAALVAARSRPGEVILALTDCPEVYFLTERRNPTPTIYDVFDPDFDDPPARAARLAALIASGGVRVAVLSPGSRFSGPPEPGCVAAIRSLLPARADAGRFEVRWAP